MNWFKKLFKREADPEEMWKILKGEPLESDDELLKQTILDSMDGKKESAAFNKYLQRKIRQARENND